MPALRLGLVVGLVGFCLWHLSGHASTLRPDQIAAALHGLTAQQWLGGLAAATLAFFAVAGQERAAFAHLGLPVDPGAGRRAAMTAAAISQTAGFGPVIGAIIRRRLLPGLTIRQSATISLVITVGFFAGLGALVGLLALHDAAGLSGLALAAAVAILALAALRLLPDTLRAHLPPFRTSLRFALWLALDLMALGLACWIVLPHPTGAGTGFVDFLPVFLLALGAGLASGSPAGAGPFEATLLNAMPQADPNLLVAGILAFRIVGYAIPALIGALWALAGPSLMPARPGPALTATTAGASWLRRLPRAELQLALQSETILRQTPDGALWLSADLATTTALIGDPVAPQARPDLSAALVAANTTARQSGSILCLYRISPRLAATARRRGMTLLPLAREAVINPLTFTTKGSARATLRRKLRHAGQGGVTTAEPAFPPIHDLSDVAALWSRRHGGERGLTMGRFSPETIAQQRLFTARAADGQLLAFVTFHAARGEWVLDLIRSRPALPDGTLYLLILHAIETAGAEGIPRLSLACAPIPGFGLTGTAGRIARRLTARAEGLHQFKQAFKPRWERRYIAAPGPLRLLVAGAAIARAIHSRRPHPQGTRTTVTLELASETT
jgi:phosphatidylglycerol lysyltransferase